MKRILDCRASDFLTFNRSDLIGSIRKAEGRTVLAEVIPTVQPLYPEVTNAELARAFGADMILLNMLDVFHPYIKGLESHALFGNVPGETMSDNPIMELKRLVGLPIGVNLEPVDFSEKSEDMYDVKQGRLATREAFARASELGIDFICLTGNPNTGVTNEAIEQAIINARQEFAGVIIAGKMHQA
ncbi:MAG: haloacid dehalogenase-like hydrolase, partial [Exiguobacterium chiriqhucha]